MEYSSTLYVYNMVKGAFAADSFQTFVSGMYSLITCTQWLIALRCYHTKHYTVLCYHHDQNKEKVIANLRDGQQDINKDDEAIIEQIRMEKSMVEQQLSTTERQLEQLRTELMVYHISAG